MTLRPKGDGEFVGLHCAETEQCVEDEYCSCTCDRCNATVCQRPGCDQTTCKKKHVKGVRDVRDVIAWGEEILAEVYRNTEPPETLDVIVLKKEIARLKGRVARYERALHMIGSSMVMGTKAACARAALTEDQDLDPFDRTMVY